MLACLPDVVNLVERGDGRVGLRVGGPGNIQSVYVPTP